MTFQADKTRTYTIEEFMELPDDGKRYELIEGELKEIGGDGEDKMAGPSYKHGIITSRLMRALGNFLETQGQSPYLALTNMAFELDKKTAPIPDVAYISPDRAIGVDLSKAFPGPPDLAIEVMSPTDKWSEVIDKVRLYQRYATRLVWIIDPFDQSVFVYSLGQARRSLLINEELSGENILPGFKLPVSFLFD
jgi:Uma2 family endonuclease